jgi:hypothetical protein
MLLAEWLVKPRLESANDDKSRIEGRPLLLYGPSFQPPSRLPEHPLVAAGDDEGFPDAGLLEGVEVFAHLVREIQDSLDEHAELLAAVGLDPLLVWGSSTMSGPFRTVSLGSL